MSSNKPTPPEDKSHDVVFFIDKQQFKVDQAQQSVRALLQDFSKEDPTQTTLVLKKGNDILKYTNLDEVISIENGMKFVVFHNTPTPVS